MNTWRQTGEWVGFLRVQGWLDKAVCVWMSASLITLSILMKHADAALFNCIISLVDFLFCFCPHLPLQTVCLWILCMRCVIWPILFSSGQISRGRGYFSEFVPTVSLTIYLKLFKSFKCPQLTFQPCLLFENGNYFFYSSLCVGVRFCYLCREQMSPKG